MTYLTLVRHGQTEWNREMRVQGTTDIPLNDTGRAQAREAAEAMRAELSGARCFLASSDLSRAQETASIIGATLGLGEPHTFPSVRERGYGEGEGLSGPEFIERWGPWYSAVVPGAESRDDLRERAVAGVREIVSFARRQHVPESPRVIVVSHGALIREVIRHATGEALPADGEKLANGSQWHFLVERDRLRFLAEHVAPVSV